MIGMLLFQPGIFCLCCITCSQSAFPASERLVTLNGDNLFPLLKVLDQSIRSSWPALDQLRGWERPDSSDLIQLPVQHGEGWGDVAALRPGANPAASHQQVLAGEAAHHPNGRTRQLENIASRQLDVRALQRTAGLSTYWLVSEPLQSLLQPNRHCSRVSNEVLQPWVSLLTGNTYPRVQTWSKLRRAVQRCQE